MSEHAEALARQATIVNQRGLHARAAAKFVRTAEALASILRADGREVNVEHRDVEKTA